MTISDHSPALPWHVEKWLNTPTPIDLHALRGRVVAIEVFQMLCPGCVSHALPQAQRLQALFPEQELAVIGLHSVFEHHAAMSPMALAAFAHEYQLTFPIAIDAPAESGPVPCTMRAWGLQGTPSLVLIDRLGHVRLRHFGRIDDLQLGATVGRLLADSSDEQEQRAAAASGCAADACGLGA